MQGLTTILLIFAALAGQSTTADYAYVGALAPVEVTATRYENEDVAWSGLMPAVEVTAARYGGEDIAWAGMIPSVTFSLADDGHKPSIESGEYKCPPVPALLVQKAPKECCDFDLTISDLQILHAIPTAMTFSGDYHLTENDTIDEDVTVTGGNAKIDGVISGDLAVMGGTVDIRGMVDGDVAVLGGNLDLTGLIDGDAAVFGGNIKNRGTIDGELHVIGGTVYLDSGSVVTGDISMVGGTVERNEHAEVLGKVESVEIKALERVLPRISRAFRFPRMIPGAAAFPRIIFLGMLVVLYLFNILIALVFPNAVNRVKTKIEENIWASVGLGIALQLLFVPIVVILAVSIIGIPIIVLLPLAVFLAALFGISALSLVAGDRVCKGFSWKVESQLGRLSLGWLAIMLIPIILIIIGPPVFVLGFVIVYVALTIGLGAVIFALLKRKPREAKK